MAPHPLFMVSVIGKFPDNLLSINFLLVCEGLAESPHTILSLMVFPLKIVAIAQGAFP